MRVPLGRPSAALSIAVRVADAGSGTRLAKRGHSPFDAEPLQNHLGQVPYCVLTAMPMTALAVSRGSSLLVVVRESD
jgi:hypothetical protein